MWRDSAIRLRLRLGVNKKGKITFRPFLKHGKKSGEGDPGGRIEDPVVIITSDPEGEG